MFNQTVEYLFEAAMFSGMAGHDLNLDLPCARRSHPSRHSRQPVGGEADRRPSLPSFDLSFAAVSKHVGVLERAGLVTREARGRERVCRINPAALADARAWLEWHEHFWIGPPGGA